VPAPANFDVVPIFPGDGAPAVAAVANVADVVEAPLVEPAGAMQDLPIATRAPRPAYNADPPLEEQCPWELYCSGLLGRRPDTTWVPDTDDEEAASHLHEELRLAREARDQAELALYEHDMADVVMEEVAPPTTPIGKFVRFFLYMSWLLI